VTVPGLRKVDITRLRTGVDLQLRRMRQALGSGMKRIGWKVGINVPEIQARMGLPHAAVGWLHGDHLLRSGETFRRPSGARLHVEPELALRIGRRVDAPCSAENARACIAAIHPALELVDYARPTTSLDEILAHGMFHAATVLGAELPVDRLDAPIAVASLQIGDQVQTQSRDDLVPTDPGETVAFVAEFLAAFGETLDAGDLILCGSYLSQACPIGAGEIALARIGPAGEVWVRIADSAAQALE